MTESRTPLPTAYKDRTRLSSAPTVRIIPSSQRPQNKPKLLDLLREALRSRHYSCRNESTYCSWGRQGPRDHATSGLSREPVCNIPISRNSSSSRGGIRQASYTVLM